MIEETIIAYLKGKLRVPVCAELPARVPEAFVVLHKGSGSRENGLDGAVIVLDSYGPTRLAAARLNEEVKAAMDDLTDLPQISASRLQNDYPAADIQNKRCRYQAVYGVTHYCAQTGPQ